jgi:hypothetical protein
MRVRGARDVVARGLVAAAALAGLAACSNGDDDATDGTLGVITPETDGSAVTPSGPPGTAAPAGTGGTGAAGTGFVSIDVQIASAGIAETLGLDRSTVAADSLDPVTLDARCTPLDGGDPAAGVEVAVVDLARLASGDRLVSAQLRYADPAPGEHDMTLQVGAAEQVTTAYTGTVTVADDGMSGTFAGADGGGTPVTGSFVCSAQAIVTTTTAVPLDAGEEVPDSAPPAGTTPAG